MSPLCIVQCVFLMQILSFVGSKTNYNELMARQLLNVAASVYGNQVNDCLRQTFPAHEGYELLETLDWFCDRRHSTCRGIIVVSNTTKHIIVGFRGTTTKVQLLMQALHSMFTFPWFLEMGKVNSYFMNAHKGIWFKIEEVLNNSEYADYNVTFTGHSLGGALATLAAARTVARGYRSKYQVTLYTFGQPRVGDAVFASTFNAMIPESYRVVFAGDIVPHLPPCAKHKFFVTEDDPSLPCVANDSNHPYHHGTEIWYPQSMEPGSKYIECLGEPTGEDFSCSNQYKYYYKLPFLYTWYHRHYFTVMVSKYGQSGCNITQEREGGFLEKLMCFLEMGYSCENHQIFLSKITDVVPRDVVDARPSTSNEMVSSQSTGYTAPVSSNPATMKESSSTKSTGYTGSASPIWQP